MRLNIGAKLIPLLLFFSANAFSMDYIPSDSVSIKIGCNPPTALTNGDALLDTDILRYYFQRTDDPAVQGLDIGSSNSCSLTSESAVVGQPDGKYYICVSVEANVFGTPAMSDRACFPFIKGPLPRPNVPTDGIIRNN